MSSRGSGATRSATAPLAGEPPISIASIVDRRHTAADRQPSIHAERHARRRHQHREIRPAARDHAGERSVLCQLAGEACPQAIGRALPIQRHIQPGSAIAACSSESRGEVPVLTGELRRPRCRQRASVKRRQRRIDAGESHSSDRQPAVLDPRRERREPGRRPRTKHAGLCRPGDAQIRAAAAPARAHPRVRRSAARKRYAAAAPRTSDRKISRPVAADVDLGRSQLRLRQQRERDRSADRDWLAKCRSRQHLDGRSIARPVEPLRHLPDRQQQQRTDCRDRDQHCTPARHVRQRRRNRRRPASRSRTHRQGSVQRCRSR